MNDIKYRNKDTKVSLIAMDLVLVLIGIFNYKLILFDCWAKCNSKFKPFLKSFINEYGATVKQTDRQKPSLPGRLREYKLYNTRAMHTIHTLDSTTEIPALRII